MNEFIIKFNELFLKTPRIRANFLSTLKNNIEEKTGGKARISRTRLFLIGGDPTNLSKVFGISSFAKARRANRTIKDIWQALKIFIGNESSFAVRARRHDKSFHLTSKDIEIELGSKISSLGKKVDLNNPERIYNIEIFKDYAYVYSDEKKGLGGLPVGTGGKAVVMFSGGFDSSAAAFLSAKRGLSIDYLYFDFAGKEYLSSVKRVYSYLKDYTGGKFYSIGFSNIVKNILKKVKPSLRQAVLKRQMYKNAVLFAKKRKAKAVITGENIAQVSTQTLNNLSMISKGIDFLFLRPLATYDKNEIIELNRAVGTYNLNYNLKEVCSISPRSNPSVGKEIYEEEKKLDNVSSERIEIFLPELSSYKLKKSEAYVLICSDQNILKREVERLKKEGYDIIGRQITKEHF